MKSFIYILFCCIFLFSTSAVEAQSFTLDSSVVHANVAGLVNVNDNITNTTANSITLRWRVIATTFPPDWLSGSAFGICDNHTCYYNSPGSGVSMPLWNDTTGTGLTFTTDPYTPGHGDFHLSLNFAYVSVGTHSVTVAITLPLGGTDTATFVINKVPSAAPSIVKSADDVVIYPNPTRDELNLVYDPASDVKSIAIYSIIGKVMAVYKVTDNNSANLNLENIPSGIYFARLVNSHGAMVATRKFTKQ